MVVNKEAFQELSKRVDALEKRLEAAENRVESLEKGEEDDSGTFADE